MKFTEASMVDDLSREGRDFTGYGWMYVDSSTCCSTTVGCISPKSLKIQLNWRRSARFLRGGASWARTITLLSLNSRPTSLDGEYSVSHRGLQGTTVCTDSLLDHGVVIQLARQFVTPSARASGRRATERFSKTFAADVATTGIRRNASFIKCMATPRGR